MRRTLRAHGLRPRGSLVALLALGLALIPIQGALGVDGDDPLTVLAAADPDRRSAVMPGFEFEPRDLAVDNAGNVYAVHRGGVYRISAAGTLTRMRLAVTRVEGVAVDGTGTVHVATAGFSQGVYRIDASGALSAVPAAENAGLSSPTGLAFDAAGNLFIADRGNHRIVKITPAGQTSTVAGGTGAGFAGDGGPATQAKLRSPEDVALDRSGTLFVADTGNGRIRRVTTSDTISTVAAAPGTHSVAVDAAGSVYYGAGALLASSDPNAIGRVEVISATSVASLVAGGCCLAGDGGAAVRTQLGEPLGIAVDTVGNVYVSTDQRLVRKIDRSGIIRTFAGNGLDRVLLSPTGIDATPSGEVYVTTEFEELWRLSRGRGTVRQIDGLPLGGIAVRTDGTVFVAIPTQNRVVRIAPSGGVSSAAGTGSPGYSGDMGPATGATLRSPADVALDAAGNLYIADVGNHAVRRVSPAGAITTIAGVGRCDYNGEGRAATTAALCRPGDMVVDGAGNVLIADSGNHRVRRVSTTGLITTIAGTGVADYSPDGTSTALAHIERPAHLAFDRAGSLYVSLAGPTNPIVRKLRLGGSIETVASGLFGRIRCRGGCPPEWLDIATDADGNLYLVHRDDQYLEYEIYFGVVSVVVNAVPQPAFMVKTLAPTTIVVDASTSRDPNGTITSFVWQWTDEGSGIGAVRGSLVKHVYRVPGQYLPLLTVTDDDGARRSTYRRIVVPMPECEITGTSAGETLQGTSGSDVICGLGGDDVIYGLGGSDVLIGGAGADRLLGGPGDDVLMAAGDGVRDFAVGGDGLHDAGRFDRSLDAVDVEHRLYGG